MDHGPLPWSIGRDGPIGQKTHPLGPEALERAQHGLVVVQQRRNAALELGHRRLAHLLRLRLVLRLRNLVREPFVHLRRVHYLQHRQELIIIIIIVIINERIITKSTSSSRVHHHHHYQT
jgi:hypothetical protein